ncbi:MAG TPA: 7-carboxy-7-deazaguanine synthase QueE [Candidatus Omnitrophota bacterium]|nr:7-carboxy-7-deazaguanine synthase QueE [Candidatus Omnitrophota bacterium]
MTPDLLKNEVAEIFSSIQGEGPFLGERHLFVRFAACHLNCEYCDETDKEAEEMTGREILEEIRRLDRIAGPHAFVSFTGGEPLLYWETIRSIAPVLREEGFRVYLETNGVLCGELEKVLACVDAVSMDIKLPSVTKDKACFEDHRRFLRAAAEKDVHVKIILSEDADAGEFDRAVDIIAGVNPDILLALQPVTVCGKEEIDGTLMEFLQQLQRRALLKLRNVRILPRLHKILGIQ